MELIRTEITLRNPLRQNRARIVTQAAVSMEEMTLCIPERMVSQLQLIEGDKRTVTFADGSSRHVPYFGLIQLGVGNRGSFCGTMVMGDTVLLGAIAMEDMDLVISPKHQRVEVNPDCPNFAKPS